MAIIKIIDVIYSSPLSKRYPAENLMDYNLKKPWLCSPVESRRMETEFRLYDTSQIDFIDIGNNGSCTFEVEVSRSSNPPVSATLLPAVSLMTLADIKEGKSRKSVFMYNSSNMIQDIAAQKWDRVKVICTQPFTKEFNFGLQFLILRSKSVWELDGEEKDLFQMETKYYSNPLEKLCTRPLIDPVNALSRGQRLVQASKAQKSPKNKTEDEKMLEADVVAYLDEEIKRGKTSYKDLLVRLEKKKKKRLSMSEILLFRKVYHEFNFSNKKPDVIPFLNETIKPNNAKSSEHASENSYKLTVNSSDPYGFSFLQAIRKSDVIHNLNKKLEVIPFLNETFETMKPNSAQGSPCFSMSDSSKNSYKLTEISAPNPCGFLFQSSNEDSNNNQKNILTKPSNEAMSRVRNPSKRPCETSTCSGSVSKKQNKPIHKVPDKKGIINRPENFIQFDGSQPSTSTGITYVDCPICFESFRSTVIQSHAATCGDIQSFPSSLDSEPCAAMHEEISEYSGDKSEVVEECCPYCKISLPSTRFQRHIERCFQYY